MEIIITENAKEHVRFFLKTGQKNTVLKIERMLEELLDTPFAGIGKPEPLKYQFSGKWSRRINREDRMVYEVLEDKIFIYSLRGHYY